MEALEQQFMCNLLNDAVSKTDCNPAEAKDQEPI